MEDDIDNLYSMIRFYYLQGVRHGQKTRLLLLSCLCFWYWRCGSCWVLSLTRRVLCTERTAASTPARRTGWGTLSRQKWWSCRRTLVPTPPPRSAASTQWCSHFATYRAWTADISPRNPPCFQKEAPRRWNRTRRLKNKGCTGRKLNYRGPFFCLPLWLAVSYRNCGCAVEAVMSGGAASDDALCCKLMRSQRPSGLSILSTSSVEVFLFTVVPTCTSLSIFQLITYLTS